MNADDESNITDIDLLPDGRICVFGTSVEVLEVLEQLQNAGDGSVSERLDCLRRINCDEHARSDDHATSEQCCDV
jgi:hypothetical protein